MKLPPAVPMGRSIDTSLPGLRGAFQKKARTLAAPPVPEGPSFPLPIPEDPSLPSLIPKGPSLALVPVPESPSLAPIPDGASLPSLVGATEGVITKPEPIVQSSSRPPTPLGSQTPLWVLMGPYGGGDHMYVAGAFFKADRVAGLMEVVAARLCAIRSDCDAVLDFTYAS